MNLEKHIASASNKNNKFPIRASYNFGIVLKNIKEFQIVSQVLENLHQAPLPQKIS